MESEKNEKTDRSFISSALLKRKHCENTTIFNQNEFNTDYAQRVDTGMSPKPANSDPLRHFENTSRNLREREMTIQYGQVVDGELSRPPKYFRPLVTLQDFHDNSKNSSESEKTIQSVLNVDGELSQPSKSFRSLVKIHSVQVDGGPLDHCDNSSTNLSQCDVLTHSVRVVDSGQPRPPKSFRSLVEIQSVQVDGGPLIHCDNNETNLTETNVTTPSAQVLDGELSQPTKSCRSREPLQQHCDDNSTSSSRNEIQSAQVDGVLLQSSCRSIVPLDHCYNNSTNLSESEVPTHSARVVDCELSQPSKSCRSHVPLRHCDDNSTNSSRNEIQSVQVDGGPLNHCDNNETNLTETNVTTPSAQVLDGELSQPTKSCRSREPLQQHCDDKSTNSSRNEIQSVQVDGGLLQSSCRSIVPSDHCDNSSTNLSESEVPTHSARVVDCELSQPSKSCRSHVPLRNCDDNSTNSSRNEIRYVQGDGVLPQSSCRFFAPLDHISSLSSFSQVQIVGVESSRDDEGLSCDDMLRQPVPTDNTPETNAPVDTIIVEEMHVSHEEFQRRLAALSAGPSDGSNVDSSAIVTNNFSEIKKLLLNDNRCKAILKFYKQNKRLEKDHQDSLIDVVLDHILSKDMPSAIPPTEMEVLVNGICSIFPNEDKAEYFIPKGANAAPSGRMYDKYNSKLKKLRRQGLFPPSTKATNKKRKIEIEEELESEDLDDILQENIQLVKSYDHTQAVDFEHVIEVWNEMYEYRTRKLRREENPDIFNDWPFLQHPQAYRLIEIDFQKKFGLALKEKPTLSQAWNTIFSKSKIVFADLHNRHCKRILNTIKKDRNTEATENEKNVILALALHGIFKPALRGLGNGEVGKSSIMDSQDSVLQLTTDNNFINAVAKREETRLAKNVKQHPVIFGISVIKDGITKSSKMKTYNEYIYDIVEVERIQMFRVIFGSMKFENENFLTALDFCFKVYRSLKIPYPESRNVWCFLDQAFYATSDETTCKIVALLNKLK